MPNVHLPRPREVVVRVFDVLPASIFGFNLVEPHLVDLEWASVMPIKVLVTVDDVEATRFLPSLIQNVY